MTATVTPLAYHGRKGYQVAWRAERVTWRVWFPMRKSADALRGAIVGGKDAWASYRAIVAPEQPWGHLADAARKGWADLSPEQRAERVRKIQAGRAASRAKKLEQANG